MKKIISPKLVALTFGILTVSFLVAFYVVAWQEPSQSPPGGNVAAPLNVGNVGQSKAGGLILNTGGAINGLIIDKGKICLGTDCISAWSQAGTGGAIVTYHMEATSYRVGNEYFSKKVTYDCPESSNVVNVYCSENMVGTRNDQTCTEDSCSSFKYTQTNSCSCSSSGGTATLAANVVKTGGACYDCTYGDHCSGRWVVNYCKPSEARDIWGHCTFKYDCYLPSGNPQCTMEFQCGIKQTVGS